MNFLNLLNIRNYFVFSQTIFPIFILSLVFKRWYIPFNFIPSKVILGVVGILLCPFFVSFSMRHKDQILNPFFSFMMVYFVFALYLIIRTCFSGVNEYFFITLNSLAQYPFFAAAGYFLSFFKKQTIIGISILSFVYFAFSFLTCLDGSIFLNPQSFKSIFGLSAKIEYQNVNFFLGLFFISSFIFLFPQKYYITFIFFIISFMTLFFMSLIGGRGSFLNCLILFPFMCLSFLFKKNKAAFLIFFLLALMVIFFCFSDKSVTLWRIGVLFAGDDSSLRKTLFLDAAKLFLSTPKTFFIGVGVGGFQEYYGYAAQNVITYPHNFILELLCETGIIGFSLFTGMFYLSYKSLLKEIKGKPIYDDYSILTFYIFLFLFLINNYSGSIASLFMLITTAFCMFPTQKISSLPIPLQKDSTGKFV